VCAVAHECLGDPEAARELEDAATELGLPPHKHQVHTPQLRLLLLRGDRERARELLERKLADARGYCVGPAHGLATLTTRLDALAELGYREPLEEHAARATRPGSYVEPFALRALGRMRGDRDLLKRALARFEALGLEWHAAQTRTLVR
jgi:hypothetical protein